MRASVLPMHFCIHVFHNCHPQPLCCGSNCGSEMYSIGQLTPLCATGPCRLPNGATEERNRLVALGSGTLPGAKTCTIGNPPSGTRQAQRQQRLAAAATAAAARVQAVLPVSLDPGTGRGIWMDSVGDSQYCGDGSHGSPLL